MLLVAYLKRICCRVHWLLFQVSPEIPMPYVALYSITTTPIWASYVFQYLKDGFIDPESLRINNPLLKLKLQIIL